MNAKIDSPEDGSGASTTHRECLAVVAITMAGALLRLHRLDAAELWTDEITGVLWSAWSVPKYFHIAASHAFLHFPLPVWILKVLITLFGDGVFVYRLLGFIPGTLAVLALYFLGKRLFSPHVGLVAAALLAFSPTAIFVSQEAWDYGLVLLMVILCAHAFFTAWRKDQWRYWWLFALCAFLCFYTHVFNALVIGSLYLTYAVVLFVPAADRSPASARWRKALPPAVVGVILATLFVPGLSLVFRTAGGEVAPESGLIGAGPVSSFEDALLTTLRHFAYDRPVSTYLLGALFLLSIPVAVRRPREWFFITLAALCIAGPLLIAYSKGIQFRVRHYSFALPFVLTVMACGIVTLRRLLGLAVRKWRPWDTVQVWPDLLVATMVMGLPCMAALNQYYMIRAPQSSLYAYKLKGLVEDRLVKPPSKIQLYSKSQVPEYREIGALLRRNMMPGDIVILDPGDAGANDTARNIVFHLDRTFGLSIPVDMWGWPQAKDYDPRGYNVLDSKPKDPVLEFIRSASLPLGGVRVFRASQRYPIGEVAGATPFAFTLIAVTASSRPFRNGGELVDYLKANRDLSKAADLAVTAEAHLNRGEEAEAERGFRESWSVYRTSMAAYNLGAILLRQGKSAEALPLLTAAVEARRDRWDYWTRTGKAYEVLGKGDEAIQSYEMAVRLPNATPLVRLDLAKLYELKKDFVSARQEYEALASELKDPGYQAAAIRMLLQENKTEEALRDGLDLVAKYPDHGGANLVTAMAYESLGDKQNAYGYLLRAADLRPDDIGVQAACADYQIALGEFSLAEARLKSALQKHPGDVTLKGLLAKLRRAVGNE